MAIYEVKTADGEYEVEAPDGLTPAQVAQYITGPASPGTSIGPVTERPPVEGTQSEYLTNIAKGSVTFSPYDKLFKDITGVDWPGAAGRQKAREAIGYDPTMKPPSDMSRMEQLIYGGAIEGLTDPTTYIPGGKAAKTGLLALMGRIGTRGAVGAGGGAGGELGGEAGAMMGKEIATIASGAEKPVEGSTTEFIGRLIGGLSGGISGGLGAAKTNLIKDAGVEVGKRMWTAGKRVVNPAEFNRLVAEETKKQAQKELEHIAMEAVKADPQLAPKLLEAQRLKGKFGVDLPIHAASGSNPVIMDIIAKASTRPQFRATYGDRYDAALSAINSRTDELFGPAWLNASDQTPLVSPKLQAKLDNKIKALDAAIAKEADRVAPTISEGALGSRIDDLIAVKETEARKIASPYYDKALDFADAKGITMPADAIGRIYAQVMNDVSENVFKGIPELDSKVRAVFKPKQVEGIVVPDATGNYPKTSIVNQFEPASAVAIDDLKQAINAQLRRKGLEDTQKRILENLNKVFKQELHKLDPEFVSMYRHADEVYWEKVGMPFNSPTLKAVDRAQFESKLIPMITSDRQRLDEFLQATGGEGAELAKNAYLLSLDKAMGAGEFDPKKARAWLKRNAEALEVLPGFRDSIVDAGNAVDAINDAKLATNRHFAEMRSQVIEKAEGKSTRKLMSEMYNDPSILDRYYKTYGTDADTLTALRSWALRDLMDGTASQGILNSPQRKALYSKLFGPKYLDNVQQLAKMSDLLGNDPTKIKLDVSKAPKGWFEKTFNFSAARGISVIRDRIMSPLQKFAVLGSVAGQARMNAANADNIAYALTQPEAVEEFAKLATKIETGEPIDVTWAYALLKKYGATIGRGARSGAIRGATEEENNEEVVLPE